MEAEKKDGRIITFYSYKGGTGRSMALVNVAWILAANRKKVFVIDWDLEAPGLHRYFRPFLIDKELTSSNGLIDLVHSYVDQTVARLGSEQPLRDDELEQWVDQFADIADEAISLQVDFPGGGEIDFLPAGCQVSSYAQKVNTFSWSDFYQRFGGGYFLEAVKRHLRNSYDYILIDSRTGVSDTAGISTVQMPDALVVCFTYNNQSIAGAAAIARSAREARRQMQLAGSAQGTPVSSQADFLVYPVPTRVEQGERDKLRARQEYAWNEFEPLVLDHAPKGQVSGYWSEVEVPYNVFHAYEETIAALTDNPNDPKEILGAIRRLTARLTNGQVQEFQQLLPAPFVAAVLKEFASTPCRSAGEDGQAPTPEPAQAPEVIADIQMGRLTSTDWQNARRLWTMLVDVRPNAQGLSLSPAGVDFGRLLPELRPLALQMIQAGLLKLRNEPGSGETLEIAHDSLLRDWQALSRWSEEDRKFLLWRTQLSDKRRGWENNQLHPSLLLLDSTLDHALAWHNSRASEISTEDLGYIAESQQRSERAWNQRYRNWSLAVSLGAIILAVVPTGVAVQQSRVADDLNQSLLSTRQELASVTNLASISQQPSNAAISKSTVTAVVETLRRAEIEVTYFKKADDPRNIEAKMLDLGYRVSTGKAQLGIPTNAVWIGCRAPLSSEDARIVASTLMAAGVVLRKIDVFASANKDRAIMQIGSHTDSVDAPPVTQADLDAFDLDALCPDREQRQGGTVALQNKPLARVIGNTVTDAEDASTPAEDWSTHPKLVPRTKGNR